MELKQVWMSRDTQNQSRYSLRTLGGILGIAMLALVLVLGGTTLGFMLGWPMRMVSVGLWLGVTVLLVVLALSGTEYRAGCHPLFPDPGRPALCGGCPAAGGYGTFSA